MKIFECGCRWVYSVAGLQIQRSGVKLVLFFCLSLNICLAQQEIEFDSINRVLTIQLSDSCFFYSEYTLTFTDDYSYFITEEKDFVYFISKDYLYGNNPFEYEISILVFSCTENKYICNKTIKIPSRKALIISLEESELTISNRENILTLELKNVTHEEIVEFKKELEVKFNAP